MSADELPDFFAVDAKDDHGHPRTFSQRAMVEASLNANHDHGTYARRKGERRQEDRRAEDRGTVTVPRERLERVERLMTDACSSVWAADDGELSEARELLRAILGDTRKDGAA